MGAKTLKKKEKTTGKKGCVLGNGHKFLGKLAGNIIKQKACKNAYLGYYMYFHAWRIRVKGVF